MAEERKLVTILFADVTGSTELDEALDPEDTRALMKRYYRSREITRARRSPAMAGRWRSSSATRSWRSSVSLKPTATMPSAQVHRRTLRASCYVASWPLITLMISPV